ncbi:MAG: HDOD domain-containing protein [Azoarcus sp.]|jgi:EAL and modified HD-GYP domain-containing signal transduction protein|nr:HDOD domain-containing protein [Azoarcus sp.]
MFTFLRKLFGGKKKDRESPRPPEIADDVNGRAENAPPQARADEANPSAFICREALLGRDQKIIGYEFSHPQHLRSRFMDKRARVHRYYDDVLLRHLSELNLDAFLGARLAFIGISPASLLHPALLRLPRKNLTLSLNFVEILENHEAHAISEIIGALRTLRESGLRIGLKWRQQEEDLSAFLPYADFIQIAWQSDADRVSGKLAQQVADIRQAFHAGEASSAAHPLRLIVSDLKTPEEFRFCYRLGFDFFRGPFIDRRESDKVHKGAIDRLRVMQLLNSVRQDAETKLLTRELRQDPVLSYRLLRYANSPALGLTYRIGNLDQALTVLGRSNLYRWLSFLLFNVADPGYYEWALTEQALARAALMERLGKKAELTGVAQDALFLTGLFSLLDRLMGAPLSELTEKIQIPEEVRVALVRREGILARFLALAKACERMNPEQIAQHAEALGLSAQTVNLAVFDALAWANEMTEISAD